MRTFTFKSLFLTVLFVLLGSTAILAADDGLITTQVTLELDEAGTLPNKIAVSRKNLITNLKIVGKINGTDLKFIREMAGRDYYGKKTDGKLSILDLSEAKIVEGGDAYVRFSENYYTSNDKLGNYVFYGCSGLTSIYVYPENLPELGTDIFTGCDAKNCTVYVPKGTGDAYFRLSEFSYFDNIVEFDATGIDKVATSTNVKEVSRYSANGQRLSAPAKGLNIVKYSDGSVKKVVVQ